jgi:hypothetical protein
LKKNKIFWNFCPKKVFLWFLIIDPPPLVKTSNFSSKGRGQLSDNFGYLLLYKSQNIFNLLFSFFFFLFFFATKFNFRSIFLIFVVFNLFALKNDPIFLSIFFNQIWLRIQNKFLKVEKIELSVLAHLKTSLIFAVLNLSQGC